MKTLFNNFFRGLLLVLPIGLTFYIIFGVLRWTNSTLNNLIFEPFNINIPGLGIITVFFLISLFGYLCSLALARPFVTFFENILGRTPLVKIIYTSIKELTEAVFGDDKRFSQPVLVDINGNGVKKLGFITQKNLSSLGLEDLVSVYCPHSYNFSGNLFLVPRGHIKPLNVGSTDLMKYVVSAGITRIEPVESTSGAEKQLS